ncbi:LysE/ArgO family amino acid transporter [Asaia krungthepensis]|uniref:Lysine efflux permease n=1 Tax=Asaia krungthepensis NRIC 0535 TaxID=1307925 RepID=A0ABQ0Q0I1_9PROT|nr:LysE family transporter [Asaia krungthepensis]GBQ86135.1 lysine efflux permease [Asaia krungthepensis NRIC 0535]
MAGFTLFASLIGAIGAQNLYVLRKGFEKTHTGMVVLFCGLSDSVLIIAGIALAGSALTLTPVVSRVFVLLGAAFLLSNGIQALRQAWREDTATLTANAPPSRRTTLTTLAALTWLNPHVYLDTVFIIGTASLGVPDSLRICFAAGAITASFVWFTGLGYGARLLRPALQSTTARQIIDIVTGSALILFAIRLARQGLGPAFQGAG